MKLLWLGKSGLEEIPVEPDGNVAAECAMCGTNIELDEECYRIGDETYCAGCVDIGVFAIEDDAGIPEPWM